jgi:very-short-patch-repair endonuclease
MILPSRPATPRGQSAGLVDCAATNHPGPDIYRALHAAGVRPIPQFSVEQYDLDFAVIVGARRLNIEVDGERYHRSWTGELCLRDQLRNQRLIELGWEVKRFWVYQVRDSLDDCVETVVRWVAEAKAAA